MTWNEAQEWERQWWGSCQNTYGEETKQLLYANRMGLRPHHDGRSPYNFDLNGRSVLDIGGGPVSLLLKCTNFKEAYVADPCDYPYWVQLRYEDAGIEYWHVSGETVPTEPNEFDEVWLYNVLQHTQDPEKIIRNAQRAGRIIRIFEWINTHINEGHPHSFTERQLNEWLGGEGKVEVLNGQANCYGRCYYGIFPTR